MSPVIEKILAPETRQPSRPPVEEVGQKLDIAVVFTSVDSTLAALKEGGNLANICRDRFETLTSILKAHSIIVLGGRKRWWPTKDETLVRQLRRAGYEVLFKETA